MENSYSNNISASVDTSKIQLKGFMGFQSVNVHLGNLPEAFVSEQIISNKTILPNEDIYLPIV